MFGFLNVPLSILFATKTRGPTKEIAAQIWMAVPFLANFVYGIYVMATQIDQAEGDSCSKMRDLAKLSSVIAIVFGVFSLFATSVVLTFMFGMSSIKKPQKVPESDPLLGKGGTDKNE